MELGIRDNDSTGKFLQQRFQLHSIQLPVGAPASEWLARLNKTKARLVVVNAVSVLTGLSSDKISVVKWKS